MTLCLCWQYYFSFADDESHKRMFLCYSVTVINLLLVHDHAFANIIYIFAVTICPFLAFSVSGTCLHVVLMRKEGQTHLFATCWHLYV